MKNWEQRYFLIILIIKIIPRIEAIKKPVMPITEILYHVGGIFESIINEEDTSKEATIIAIITRLYVASNLSIRLSNPLCSISR